MKKLKNVARKFFKDESAQGTAEYVLLIAIVVALVFAFRGKISDAVKGKMDEVGGQISGFSGE